MKISTHVIRPPERTDAPAIVALMAEAQTALYGESDATLRDVHFIWSWPRFDLRRDAWLVEADGNVVGYGWVWGPRLPLSECDGWFQLSASAPDDLAGLMIARMEARALERVAEAGTSGAPSLAIPASAIDQRKLEQLREHGYRPIRTSYHMERPLDSSEQVAPRWPPGVEVATFLPGIDESDVYDAIQDSFADHFRFTAESLEDWSRRAYGHADFAPELTFLVRERGRVVAVSVNYRFNAADGWIGMLGVRREWRRHGLATALLHQSFDAFRAAGCRKALLGVDSENADGAVRLYESVGLRITRRHQLHERALV